MGTRHVPCPDAADGSQYVSIKYTERLAAADHALAETINGLYKAELIHRRLNIPPAEAEQRYYAMRDAQSMTA